MTALKRFILMIQFLTRIPIPVSVPAEDEDFNKALIFFPLVGLIIGGMLFVVHYLLQTHVSLLTVSAVLVVAEILITGGLHLDGLADSFDGLYSYRSKERILEIMKDSHIGANGVLALIGFIILKVVLLMEVLAIAPPIVLVLMPVLTRALAIFSAKRCQYARQNGMGNYFIGRVSNLQMGLVLFQVLILGLLIQPFAPWSVAVFLPMMAFAMLYEKHCFRIIGGMTGDTIGALNEMSALIYLIGIWGIFK